MKPISFLGGIDPDTGEITEKTTTLKERTLKAEFSDFLMDTVQL
jgi:predicted aconitase with swiveling domain